MTTGSPPPSAEWRDGGRIVLRLRAVRDRFRTSLFGLPAVWIVGAVLLASGATTVDRHLADTDLPTFLDTTVESARAILTAVASGTITAASVVFSLTLVAIQLASSAYSSRVMRSFLRDRFQQHVMGLVLGTYFYSLLVLRVVRAPIEQGGTPYVPSISTFLAVVLALAAGLALLGSISHTAQNLRVAPVTRRLVGELRAMVGTRFRTTPADDDPDPEPPTDVAARSGGAVLTASDGGWVQQISIEAIFDAIEDGSTVRLDVAAGTYVYDGAPLLTLWPRPGTARVEPARDQLRDAFGIGPERTLQQDVLFGLTMLEDIALKALSPGINDPNTATAVLPQLGDVVLTILLCDPLPRVLRIGDCVIERPYEPTTVDVVDTAFEQIRVLSTAHPAVQQALADTLITIGDELVRRGHAAHPAALDPVAACLRRLDHDIRGGAGRDRDRMDRVLADAPWFEAEHPELSRETPGYQ